MQSLFLYHKLREASMVSRPLFFSCCCLSCLPLQVVVDKIFQHLFESVDVFDAS
jgi:hypothetical protein